MNGGVEDLAARLRERFARQSTGCAVALGEVTLEVCRECLHEVCEALCREDAFGFAELIDLAGIDYLEYGQADWETSEVVTGSGYSRGVEKHIHADAEGGAGRFAVVYHLLSVAHNARLRVRCRLPGDAPRVDSVVDVWSSANWFEREAFDLFGILFDGHPDLRRILTDYGFIGHPFRKDFPLSGEVEMRYDPEKRRVIYEPVSIEPRVLVPRVIRHDARYAQDEAAAEPADAEGAGDA